MDIEQALAESEGLRERFWKWLRWPGAQPFSGGVEDWPAREADALAFAASEWRLVHAYVSQEAQRG